MLDDLYAAELARIHELYALRLSQRRASGDIADVARAATYGLVDTVLVDIDEVVPGFVDEESGAVTFAADDDAVNYGVVDVTRGASGSRAGGCSPCGPRRFRAGARWRPSRYRADALHALAR